MSVKKKRDFDSNAFLTTIGEGRKFVLPKEAKQSSRKGTSLTQCFIFRPQGEIDRLSNDGKKATIDISSAGDLLSPRVGMPLGLQGDPRVRHAYGELGAKAS
jgi:hypothetical protein